MNRIEVLLLLCWLIISVQASPPKKPIIAIVGGGIGGSSTAYFLRELLGESVQIILFENTKVGGRAATIKFADAEFEAGASIVHSRNRYIGNFVDSLNLSRVLSSYSGNAATSFFDGQSEAFRLSSGKVWQLVSLLWRYGFSLRKVDALAEQLLDRFDRIYKLQEQRHAFRNLRTFMRAVDADLAATDGHLLSIEALFNRSSADFIEMLGLNKKFFDEVVQGITMSNYGQPLSDLHAFVGFVSLVGGSSDLFAVKGGNYRVVERLVERSEAQLRHDRIDRISQRTYDQSAVRYALFDKADNLVIEDVDYVVLAAPQFDQSADCVRFSFENCVSGACVADEGSVERGAQIAQQVRIAPRTTIATFVHGLINRTTFPFVTEDLSVAHHVLVTRSDLPFNSIGRQTAVDGRRPPAANEQYAVYKVFSQKPLDDVQLHHLFERVEAKESRQWLAYPHYAATRADKDDRVLDVELGTNLYYINSIERVASALEMSAIAAKNVALLIANSIEHTPSNVDGSAHAHNAQHDTSEL